MLNYDQFKQAYSTGTEEQKASREKRFGGNADFQQFKSQWEQEQNNPASLTNQPQNQNFAPVQNGENQGQNQASNFPQPVKYGLDKQFDPSEQLDQSKFTNPNAKVQIQEGTGAQTGQPDYSIESEARDREIINNLNSYKVSNPEFFRDRETFNRAFQYHDRESERQRGVLDSVWRRIEDENKVSSYTNPESAISALNNAELTKDQREILGVKNPELKKAIDKKIEEETNLRIVNKTAPSAITDNAELLKSLVERMGISSGVPYNIHQTYRDNLERYGVIKDNEKIEKMQTQIINAYQDISDIEAKIRSQSSGASESLIQARMQKASSALYSQVATLQQGYTTLLQGRNHNLAIANADTEALIKQTHEDQRIFDNKLKSLGFAMNVASFETPEQKREAELQYQEKLGNIKINLQKKEKEMEANLTSSLQDLSVADPQQLRSNLFNALNSYYKEFGSIIQRGQSGVVDDILTYAKKHGVSVAEAMRKNFIEPLQGKKEYKMLMNRQYGISNEPIKDSIGSYNGANYIMSYDENGNLKLSQPLVSQALTPQTGSGMKGAGLRNNNPGNIKDQNFGNPIGVDHKGFAQFASPEDGFDALVEKIKFNQTSPNSRYYGKTIAQYFKMYAPDSDGNNSTAYANSVAKQLGVSVNTPISQVDPVQFAKHIAKHDSGYNYSTYGQFRGVNNANNSATYNPNRVRAYEEYIRKGIDPSSTELKSMGISLDTFYSEVNAYKAETGYNPLSNDQMTLLNSMSNTFANNAQVKAFDEAYSQFLSLSTALNSMSGPGDVSAVFNFMKTLDPDSVVREGEFELAAKSAGVWNQWKNILNKLNTGQMLGQEQREAFRKIAKGFVLNKAKIYDTKYSDLTRKLQLQGIPEAYRPSSLADEMRESLGIKEYNLNFSIQTNQSNVPLQSTPQVSSQYKSSPPESNPYMSVPPKTDTKSVVSSMR